jgi:glycogen debranching enzyme
VAGELILPAVTDPDRLVMSRGNLFSVTSTTGNIAPAGARELGVFHQDTRHLSYYELILPAGAPTKLSADAISAVLTQIDLTATDVEFGGLLDEPINFLHIRRKQHLDDEFLDQLIFTNYLGHAVDLDLEIRFAADFADIFEVRGARRAARGEPMAPIVDGRAAVDLRYRGRDHCTYVTRVRFHPPPASLDAGAARLRVHLEPGESQLQEVTVTPARFAREAEARLRPLPHVPFDTRVTRTNEEAAASERRSTRLTCDNRLVHAALERAFSDVHALRVAHDGRWIVGAGIPWYAAPFGRDSLITSAQMLPVSPDLAVETLRFLGRYQGTREDVAREEEPGKIMHELRRGEMAATGEIPHSPYYGTVDATALYVILAGETWRWTGDRDLLAELWPRVTAAMEWIERHTAEGTRFLAYERRAARGLDNQGWKDSRDGVSFPDGRRARPPIHLVEVQGYCVDAWRHAARLAAVMGDAGLEARWASRVEPFRRKIDAELWYERTQFYCLAIDGEGRQVPTVTSNPGHLLWSRALAPERAPRVAAVLLSPEMWSGWGVRTLSRGQPVYNPISYHNGTVWPHDNAICGLGMARHGLQGNALRILDALLDASRSFRHQRLPELFCGMGRGDREFLVQYPVSCSPQAWAAGSLFMLLQGTLGLDADASAGRLRIWNPRLPASVRRLELRGMRVGPARVSLRFARTGDRTHVDVMDVAGGPLRVEIEIG